MIFMKNMAAGPSSSRASFPSFARFARPSPALQKCPMPATSPSTYAGAFLWVGAMILGGYALGTLGTQYRGQRIHYVIAVVIFVSVLPVIISFLRSRRSAATSGAEGK